MEKLSIDIENDENTTEIKNNKTQYLISKYADDTSIILDESLKSLRATRKEKDGYLRLLMDFQWTTQFKHMRINYELDLDKILNLNYDKKL